MKYQVYVPEWGEDSPEDGREVEAESPSQAAEKVVEKHHREADFDEDSTYALVVKEHGVYQVGCRLSFVYITDCLVKF